MCFTFTVPLPSAHCCHRSSHPYRPAAACLVMPERKNKDNNSYHSMNGKCICFLCHVLSIQSIFFVIFRLTLAYTPSMTHLLCRLVHNYRHSKVILIIVSVLPTFRKVKIRRCNVTLFRGVWDFSLILRRFHREQTKNTEVLLFSQLNYGVVPFKQ